MVEKYYYKVLNTDVLDGFRLLPDSSINCIITSPPYWQLRDYKFEGQWGLEPDYRDYLEKLWSMMDEAWRVLKDNGSVWVSLGDTYGAFRGKSGGGADSFERLKTGSRLNTVKQIVNRINKNNEMEKCLMMIPARFAIGCIERGWTLRNDIIWGKVNAMPESVTDRFSKKHEFIFFFTKTKNYYFDLDAVRDRQKSVLQEISNLYECEGQQALGMDYPERVTDSTMQSIKRHTKIPADDAERYGSPRARYNRVGYSGKSNIYDKGKNPGDVVDFWDVPTKPNNSSHYAAFNSDLISKPLLAGCPENGIVLDPFAGLGTTVCRALELKRIGFGFEGNAQYAKDANNDIRKLTLPMF